MRSPTKIWYDKALHKSLPLGQAFSFWTLLNGCLSSTHRSLHSFPFKSQQPPAELQRGAHCSMQMSGFVSETAVPILQRSFLSAHAYSKI